MKKLVVIWSNGDKSKYDVEDYFSLNEVIEKLPNSLVVFSDTKNDVALRLLRFKDAREIYLE